ncbi:UNVERIFIED_CONTAM: hypothetical protein FKN15_078184, partial [Acipenser sinensis]
TAEFGVTPSTPFLPHPGDPQIPWTQWLESFNMYLLASDLQDMSGTRKRAILIHCLGPEGQHIFKTLGDSPSFKNATTKLTQHFGPRHNAVEERCKFRCRAQFQGESVRQYIANLKELAATCKFEDQYDQMIWDQFIEKKTNSKIREHLLMEPDTLTLDRTLEIACQIEAAVAEAKQLSAEQPQSTLQENETTVQAVASHGHMAASSGRCGNCGATRHKTGRQDCIAKDKRC